jgi:hypothetical protein
VLLLLLTTGAARADEVVEPGASRDAAAAEALFRDGRTRMEAGDYSHACPLFAESWRLDAALGTLFNLARCEELTGRLASAWERYGELVDRMPPEDERHAIVLERRAALDRVVPRLTLALGVVAPADLQMTRDGVELGAASLGLALPLDPGTHEVVLRASGFEARRYSVIVASGDRRTLVLELGPRIRKSGTAGYVVGGAGIVSVALGVVFGVRALQQRDASDADCSGGACRDAWGAQAYASARESALGADVAFGIGAVALAAGAYLAWVAPSHGHASAITVTPSGLGARF